MRVHEGAGFAGTGGGRRDMTRMVVKIGGRVAADSAGAVLDLVDEGNDVCVVHGAGPQISHEMELAGIPVEFVDGRRVTSLDGLGIVKASFAAVNRELCKAIGDRAVPLTGDEAGLKVEAVPELGYVAEAVPWFLPEVAIMLDLKKIPVISPVTEEYNVNADSAAAAIAAGIEAERLLFLTDVDGLILDGEVVDSIDLESAEELIESGTLEGGIIPKLGAAIAAARNGVPAFIGRTEVPTL
jgi:acetylglutamate kinase